MHTTRESCVLASYSRAHAGSSPGNQLISNTSHKPMSPSMAVILYIFAVFYAVCKASEFGASQLPLQAPDLNLTNSLLSLHKSLVEIPSITESEHAVAIFLQEYLKNARLTVELQYVGPGRENVLAYIGERRETRILVTSHLDTVPPFIPYNRTGDTVYGRGSVDAKGSVAAQITAFQALHESGTLQAGDVALLFVVGEEHGAAGMKAANDLGLSWEAVIFGEPTELKLARGHKGGLSFNVTAKGKAGHSGYPEQGRNAIDILIDGLTALRKVELPSSEEFGTTTINIGQIFGGVAGNVIPADALAKIVVRTAVDDIASLRELLNATVSKVSPWLGITFSEYSIGPVPIDYDIPGFETVVTNYGTDIPALKGQHKRYLYGPGTILVAHSADEHIEVADLVAAVKGYEVLIQAVLERS